MDFKVGFIERVQLALDDPDLPTITKPTSYFRSIGCSEHDVTTNVARYGKWSKPEELEKLMKKKLANLKRVRSGTLPFVKLESVLLAKIKEQRKKSRRVSNSFIRINALQIFKELKSNESLGYHNKMFKASTGWQCKQVEVCQEKKWKENAS